MSISSINYGSSLLGQSVRNISNQLSDLSTQLSTGVKSPNYAGMGVNEGFAIAARSQLANISAFADTMSNVNTIIDSANTVLQSLTTTAGEVQQEAAASPQNLTSTGQTIGQQNALAQLSAIVGMLNTQVGDRYIFSGTAIATPAVATADDILDGTTTRAGLKQVIAERAQADLGTNGLGRLVITGPNNATPPVTSATQIQIAEDSATSPFGLKLNAVSSSLTNTTVTGPSGSPAAVGIDMTAGNPNPGDQISFTFNLPDGSTEDLVLEATTSATPNPGQFTIGPNANQTAINFQAALTTSVDTLANTSLSAASAVAAATDFFANPPMRVVGPPFTSANSQIAGTPANTIQWYIGENGPNPPRSTAVARIDPSITVQYGLRANEQGIAWIVQQVATLAATTYSAANPNAQGSYVALNQRLDQALTIPQGVQKIEDIQASVASAQTAMQTTKDRHQQTNKTLTDMLQSIEGIDQNQVGVQILALQTSLQASFQTTAMLSQLSLVKVL
jgi:flagellar hook-associated protein 3 FlgL